MSVAAILSQQEARFVAHSAETVWRGPQTRLDRALVATGMVDTRNRAQAVIAAGLVLVANRVQRKPSYSVTEGQLLTLQGAHRYVSRAAQKLESALTKFQIDPEDLSTLDLGASTGGFTQVLAERGAAHILAVDVGHGQMHPSVASLANVTNIEGENARDLTRRRWQQLTAAPLPQLIVGDLSFISLQLIFPVVTELLGKNPSASAVLLIKPQFEAGKQRVKDGVLRDPQARFEAVWEVVQAAAANGLQLTAFARSPIAGNQGNIEFLAQWVPSSAPNTEEWKTEVASVCLREES
ncbi:TlyA family RNA methyltransferase [Canibacter zhoujuaniae]|uniref:TlyA family RNA methyltransferase n=1 Tax=Canibacter zhoujuaniae TaxID=2708343 RepID=UPI001421C82E|nr:TlyA family RNA methyltransferase [Canibacter zhoujuaniae]